MPASDSRCGGASILTSTCKRHCRSDTGPLSPCPRLWTRTRRATRWSGARCLRKTASSTRVGGALGGWAAEAPGGMPEAKQICCAARPCSMLRADCPATRHRPRLVLHPPLPACLPCSPARRVCGDHPRPVPAGARRVLQVSAMPCMREGARLSQSLPASRFLAVSAGLASHL